MDSVWITFMPFAFYFGWLMARQQFGTTCPHCGGELAGTVGRKPKAVDDELAGRRAGFSSRHKMILFVILQTIFCMAMIYFNDLTARRAINRLVHVPPALAVRPLPAIQAAPPLPPPIPAGRVGGG